MRQFLTYNYLVLLFAGAFVTACVKPVNQPMAVSQRMLTLPKKEGQVLFAGPVAEWRDKRRVAPIQFDPDLRYGITDRLEYQFPLKLRYRLGGRESQLVLGGESWFRFPNYRPNSGDPRVPTRLDDTAIRMGVIVAAKHVLSDKMAVEGELTMFRWESTTTELHAEGGSLHVALVYEATNWLSLGLPVGVFGVQNRPGGVLGRPFDGRWQLGRGGRIELGGFAGKVPPVSLHVMRWLDVVLVPAAYYDLYAKKAAASVNLGLNWHWSL